MANKMVDARTIVNIEFTGNVRHAVAYMERAVWIMPFLDY